MKVLLDEMLPAGVAGLLPGHAVTTAQQAGLKGLKNGELLRRAVAAGFGRRSYGAVSPIEQNRKHIAVTG